MPSGQGQGPREEAGCGAVVPCGCLAAPALALCIEGERGEYFGKAHAEVRRNWDSRSGNGGAGRQEKVSVCRERGGIRRRETPAVRSGDRRVRLDAAVDAARGATALGTPSIARVCLN